ncbi:hypothetical protein PIB30_051838, partial [Stylosanthes scabra]|nr:hypothetical protein [Stylosanthes scabra]
GLSVTHERCNLLMTIAPVTEAKVTGSSPTIYDPCGGNAESTQKGDAGCFGVSVTFAREEPCLASSK